MTIAVTPSQSDTLVLLKRFLTEILPQGTEINKAQVNRVPEPQGSNFVEMTVTDRPRLGTNLDNFEDASFVGSIAANVLTVSSILFGIIGVGRPVYAASGVSDGTVITALGTGTGGNGTYIVNNSQTVSSRAMASGIESLMQPTNVTVQLDVHGPLSADNAQMITTLMRDEYAVSRFASYGPYITPLNADDPRQVPFINDQKQYEDRWIIEVQLQVNQSVVIPQQFAEAVDVDLVSVEAAYPF